MATRQKAIEAEVIIVGGGLAGLSAAIYLGRARRDTLLIDEKKSMARWEPEVQNYLGFPKGISGTELLARGHNQARRYGLRVRRDHVLSAHGNKGGFLLQGRYRRYRCKRLLLATGIFHIPPDIRGVKACLGHSLFFCKDCDGYRVRGKDIAIYGWTREAVEYAVSMLAYSPCVFVLTDGRKPKWSRQHAAWVKEYRIPVCRKPIARLQRAGNQIQAVQLADGKIVKVEAIFTTRGDIYFNKLARGLGARLDKNGEIIVDLDARTTLEGLYAAGCVTPANCQMIIAAGQGAIAAQTINRELTFESLATRGLRRIRGRQLRTRQTKPIVKSRGKQAF